MKKKFGIIYVVLAVFCAAGTAFAQKEEADDHFDTAVKYYLSNDFDSATAELNKALFIDPNHAQAAKLLPIVQQKKAEMAHVKKKPIAEKENLYLADHYFEYALSKYCNNDLYGAFEELNKALKIAPDHKKAKELFYITMERMESVAKKEETPSITNLLPFDKRREKIKIFLKNEDMGVALRTVSQLVNVNIVFPEEISGKVTANFVNAPPEEVINSILNSAGYTYLIEGSVVRVVKIDESKFLTKIFKLKHTFLTESQIGSIREALSDKAKLYYEPKSHTLMITDTYGYIHTIDEMVKKIDVSRPQVFIEAKVMEVSPAIMQKVGVKWEQDIYAEVEGGERPVFWPLADISTMPYFQNTFPISKPPETGETPDFPVSEARKYPYAEADDFTFGSIAAGSLKLTLEYLENDDKTTVLSNPKLLAIDDEESEIVIGKVIPIPTYERNSETGEMEVTGYTDQEVGIVLTVTQRIHKDNYITLTVHPEVSSIIGYTGPNNERPITSTREVSTTLQIKNGDTVVIGGLISEEEITNIIKLPFLGDLPIIGFAFSHKTTDKEKREIVIFLTVTISKEYTKDEV